MLASKDSRAVMVTLQDLAALAPPATYFHLQRHTAYHVHEQSLHFSRHSQQGMCHYDQPVSVYCFCYVHIMLANKTTLAFECCHDAVWQLCVLSILAMATKKPAQLQKRERHVNDLMGPLGSVSEGRRPEAAGDMPGLGATAAVAAAAAGVGLPTGFPALLGTAGGGAASAGG